MNSADLHFFMAMLALFYVFLQMVNAGLYPEISRLDWLVRVWLWHIYLFRWNPVYAWRGTVGQRAEWLPLYEDGYSPRESIMEGWSYG